jgi:tRNA A-37 threonylcarbamoyl transferase component Bud32
VAPEGPPKIHAGMVIGGEYQIVPVGEHQLELGHGGQGAIYLAKDVRLERQVVIKTIIKSAFETPEKREAFVQRFLNEAKAAASCNHPALVTLYRAGVERAQDLLWYSMEYIPGAIDLQTRLSQCKDERGVSTMPFEEVRTYLTEIARGLREIHGRNIVHRDIKPKNLLVFTTPDGPRLKVLDFGIARMPEAAATRVSFVIGTPGYVSPDRARAWLMKDKYVPQPSDDFYSLGVVAYEMLTGHVPLAPQEHDLAGLEGLVNSHAPSPRLLRPDTPAGFEHVTLRLLENAAEYRYQTAQELLDDLRDLEKLPAYVARSPRDAEARAKDAVTNAHQPNLAKESVVAEKPKWLGPGGFRVGAPAAAAEKDGAYPTLSQSAVEIVEDEGVAPTAGAVPSRSLLKSLPPRVQLGLAAGIAALAVVFLVVVLSMGRHKSPTESVALTPIVDPDILQAKVQPTPPEELLELERKKRDEKVLEARRTALADQAAAHAPVTPAENSSPEPTKGAVRTRAKPSGARAGRSEASTPSGVGVPAAPEPRRKNIDQIIAAGPEGDAAAKPSTPGKQTFGVGVDTKLQARLASAISSEAPETLVVATLTKTFQGLPGTTPLPSGTKLFGQAQYNYMSNRIDLVFTKMQLPGTTATLVISARTVEPNGQAGVPAKVAKRDQRAKANLGEAALDVVNKVVGDAPGSAAAGRFENDKRDDARHLRNATTTLSLPVNTRLTIQFLQGV